MKPETPLDYAVFQLSPRHSRCELFVSSNGNTEKLASGLVKPFVSHLKVAEDQFAWAVDEIKLEVERHRNAETWFTKGTVERFVRFVSTPEVLEMVNSFDAEVSQLEGARKIYSQGNGDQLFGALGGDGTGTLAGADATKKELLRAIDVRLTAVRQDLMTAYTRASAASFNPETVSDLQLFSDCFGANRLNEACTKFISLCERRSDFINSWKPGAGQEQQLPDLTQTSHQLNHSNSSSSAEQIFSQKENNIEEKKKEECTTEPLPIQPSQPVRRLSVQDRINLFENKQKENSGGKPVTVVKPSELRRPSSDVSSTCALEKTVLRRWSGASDMSIDLGHDKKDSISTDSPSDAVSLSSVSQSKSNVLLSTLIDDNEKKGLNDTASSEKAKAKSVSGVKNQNEVPTRVGGFMGKGNEMGFKGKANWKGQGDSQDQLNSFIGRTEQIGVDQGVVDEKLKGTLVVDDWKNRVKDQAGFERVSAGYSDRGETVVVNNQAALSSQVGNFSDRAGIDELGNRVEDVITRDQLQSQPRLRGSQAHARSLSGQFESGFGLRVREMSSKETEGDHLASHTQWRSFTTEIRQGGKNSLVMTKEAIKEDLEVPKIKVQKPLSSAPEQNVKLQGRYNETGSGNESNKLVLPSKKVLENKEGVGNVPVPSVAQIQRVRQSKGNQELNDELKMKANELEKLFAEHKQSGSIRRSKPTELQVEQAISSQCRKSAAVDVTLTQAPDKKAEEPITSASENTKFSTPPPMKMVDRQDYSSYLRHKVSELGFSDDSRGKFYERYMQKRDAKLKEEWSEKRAEKEAKLKAMQDNLERSRAEIKAKLSVSAERSMSSAHQRAEKLKMYRSNSKREQHLIDSLQSEEDEDSSYLLEQKYYGQDGSFAEASLVNGSSKSSQNKKLSLNKSLASSIPRTTGAPIPRSSANSNPGSGRRRAQSENPLAQSVPNLLDFRKESTKSTSGVGKTANRMQARTYARSRDTTEETPLAKEEKPWHSELLRKSSATPAEFKDLSLSSDNDVATIKFDKDQTGDLYEKIPKKVDSKVSIRKGKCMGSGAGSSIAKLKTSVASEAQVSKEEFEESPFEADNSTNVAKEEDMEEEELETTEVEEYANNANGKPRLSQESDKISESENDDSLRSPSQIDPASVADLPTSVPSILHTVVSLQDSPEESPVSWNFQMHNTFSYQHEISDIDAYVDSPIGSPASWNSHSLTQTEVDAARMRKKWGSAQKPILVANSSHTQGRKDVTKGFKRLLKFGRKSRGTDNLVDWISATTSEGDDDTEDGRDPANRSSEDLRRSRMGFSQSHASDDGFNESELYNEQVQALRSSIPAPPANFRLRDDHMSGSSIKAPRSFFSLSTFRGKGGESKLR